MLAPHFPGETPSPALPSVARRWARRLGYLAILVLTLFGPWPVDNSSYRGTSYEASTLRRLEDISASTESESFQVGLAEVDLTPTSPTPLAGFSNQVGKVYASVDTPCMARALTIATATRTVTIVTADLLLINEELSQSIAQRAKVRVEDLYLTSSHTHGGPGSWGRHPLEQIVAGKFDAHVLAQLGDQIGDCVRKSRATLTPAEMALVQAHPSGRQKNRVVPGDPTHDVLSALVFRSVGASTATPPLAILTVFGAHATIVRTDPPRLSADYPGALAAALKAKTGSGMVFFAAGAVGDAAPMRPDIPASPRAAKALGELLAQDLMEPLSQARFDSKIVVDHIRLAVDLPPVRLSFFSAWLRFSPAATWWIADQTTHLSALRLGPAVMLGFPGDEAGHLAQKIVDRAGSSGPKPIITSFNGDYRGYFESRAIYHSHSCYETRWMNFYGPWLGEFLGEIASAMTVKLSGGKLETAPLSGAPASVRRIVALVVVISIWLLSGARGRDLLQSLNGIDQFAFLVAGGFTIATAGVPQWIDWAKFGGLQGNYGFGLGLALALLCLVTLQSGRWCPRCSAVVGIIALGILTACWPIILAALILALGKVTWTPQPEAAHQS